MSRGKNLSIKQQCCSYVLLTPLHSQTMCLVSLSFNLPVPSHAPLTFVMEATLSHRFKVTSIGHILLSHSLLCFIFRSRLACRACAARSARDIVDKRFLKGTLSPAPHFHWIGSAFMVNAGFPLERRVFVTTLSHFNTAPPDTIACFAAVAKTLPICPLI